MSCIRLEPESLRFCKIWGKRHEDPGQKRNYYGFACTYASHVKEFIEFGMIFSPILDTSLKSYFHCDIYLTNIAHYQIGVAAAPEMSYYRELLIEKWAPVTDKELTSKKILIPPS